MALPTIIAPAPAGVTDTRSKPCDARTKAENYEVFRAIKDAQFVEPLRAARSDVVDVANEIRGWLKHSEGRNTFDTFALVKPETEDWFFRARKNAQVTWNGQQLVPGTAAGSWEGFGFQTSEGVSYRMEISPGTLRFEAVDVNRQEKTRARALATRMARKFYAEVEIGPYPEKAPGLEEIKLPSRGEVVEWSAKSRSKMQLRIPGLDFSDWLQSDGTLAMVTLTLPGDWEVLVPDGKTFKKMIQRFLKRWERKIGRVRGLWKLEFQGRGAPHLHCLMRIPALVDGEIFEEWLSRSWADCVGASKEVDGLDSDGNDDSEYLRHLRAGTGVDYSGRDYTDPRRISQYFAGHSSKHADGKEYQHIVPALWQEPGKGPGRFWGYWGLEPATVVFDVDRPTAIQAERIARKVRRAQSWKVAVTRQAGKAKGAGLQPLSAFDVEVPKPRKLAGGRAAHRTRNRRAWWESQQFQSGIVRDLDGTARVVHTEGTTWDYQKRTPNKALGAAGGFTGGWLQVNDGLALAYDLARAIAFEQTGPVVPPAKPGSKRDILQRKLTLAKENRNA